MPMHTNDEIIAAYPHWFADGGGGAFDWAATDLLELTHDDPERAWSITVRIIDAASDDLFLAVVAAGPLEDLLTCHGSLLIERAEAAAVTDAKLLNCFAAMYLSGMTPAVRDRIRALLQAPA
jgi:uncharacterized protein DUF6869